LIACAEEQEFAVGREPPFRGYLSTEAEEAIVRRHYKETSNDDIGSLGKS
jgi:hypothetical protein